MRGRPVIQWVLFLAAWACLAWPIVTVTRSERTMMRAATPPDTTNVMTWVSLRFSTEPSFFELRQSDNLLWREDPAGDVEFDTSFPVSLDEFGAEFHLLARLPGPGVIEIKVEPDARQERAKTLWIDGDVDEHLVFRWSRDG
jgi:hypothetical protein